MLDLRIADFGEARRLEPDGAITARAGTRGYMAPEVLAGLPYGLAADVWSLGVILFTLLCGRHPFACDDEADEEAAVRGGHLSFADPNWAEVSEAAKAVVRRFLSQAPQARPKAHEALVLPWVTSNPESDPTGVISAESTPTGVKRDGRLERNASLPGSSSLLELRSLGESKHVAPRYRGECDRVPCVPPPCATAAPSAPLASRLKTALTPPRSALRGSSPPKSGKPSRSNSVVWAAGFDDRFSSGGEGGPVPRTPSTGEVISPHPPTRRAQSSVHLSGTFFA